MPSNLLYVLVSAGVGKETLVYLEVLMSSAETVASANLLLQSCRHEDKWCSACAS